MSSLDKSLDFGTAKFIFNVGKETRIITKLPALQFALVNREVSLNDDIWKGSGLYFLFGTGTSVFSYKIYVGMSPAGVSNRIKQHSSKDWWDRALVVVSDTSQGFTTSELGWLEARFISRLNSELGIKTENILKSKGDSLAPWDTKELESYVYTIETIVRLLGFMSPYSEPEIVSSNSIEENSGVSTLDGNDNAGKPRRSPQINWVDASLLVLPDNGESMHANEILKLIILGKIRNTENMATPENTLRRDLRVESQKEFPRIKQTGPATFSRGV